MLRRIAWAEGMALSPHHFQYADELVEDLFREENRSRTFGWGLRDLSLDENALLGGVIQVRACSGYFPDGAFFSVTAGQGNLETRNLAEYLLPNLESVGLYIGQALPVPGRSALGHHMDRVEEVLPDLLDGGAPRSIAFVKPVFRLLFSTEEMSAYRVLKIGEIVRNEQGLPCLSSQYVPALVRIGASSLLQSLLQKVIDASTEKQTVLRSQKANANAANVETLMLQMALQGSLPILNHFKAHSICHPDQLYRELARLASSLDVFSRIPQAIPQYNHDALGVTFRTLCDQILQALKVEQKVGFSVVVFTQQNPMVYQAAPSWNLSEYASCYIAVRSALSRTQVLQEITKAMKLSAPGQLQSLVTSAVRGIELSVVDEPPVQIRDTDKLVFFRLQMSGNFWDEVVRSKNIAAYVAPMLQVQELSLVGVR